MTLSLSVIIPTFERPDTLAECLASLQPDGPKISEILVIDQSMRNETACRIVCARVSNVHYVHLPRANLPLARNQGIQRCRSDIILFLDDDTTMEPGCIEEHIRIHNEGTAQAVAGRIRQKKGIPLSQDTVARVDTRTGESFGNFDLENEGPVSYACGAHMSFRKDLLIKAGFFDERFAGNALFEDSDLSFRSRKKGGTIWYAPKARVVHRMEDTGGCRWEGRTAYLLSRMHNHALFYFRHISKIPSAAFLWYMKNLAEFTCRRAAGGHQPEVLFECGLRLIAAYYHSLLAPKVTRSIV